MLAAFAKRAAGIASRASASSLASARSSAQFDVARVVTTSAPAAAAAEAAASSASSKPSNLQEFQIYRWDPETGGKPRYQTYKVDTNACGPMMLDVLFKIKDEQDNSLSFRRSCREGICGSCAMNIDGVNT
jgi:succinate dehydrogenase (ubiquinone) iron-sulfur subunit|eukprot:15573-Pelagococcus_subviridis.AAC.1